MQLKMFKFKPDDGVPLPLRGSTGAAGLDFRSPVDAVVPARGSVVIDTGVGFEIPHGWCGQVLGRSGLGFSFGIESRTGLIDEDYHGAVKIKLYNNSDKAYRINRLDKIAQIIFVPVWSQSIDIISVNEVSYSERGQNGFGSTGK